MMRDSFRFLSGLFRAPEKHVLAPRDLVIPTQFGPLTLAKMTQPDAKALQDAWPMGFHNGPEGCYALVFQKLDGREQHGIKMQPPDGPEEVAQAMCISNRALIALSISSFLTLGFKGIMIPCAYLKQKESGLFESGIAFFPAPHPDDAALAKPDRTVEGVDQLLGIGASEMVFSMIQCVKAAADAVGQPLAPVIGLDLRPRLALGGIILEFLTLGQTVYSLKRTISPDEPIWSLLVRTGINRVLYAPSVPAQELP